MISMLVSFLGGSAFRMLWGEIAAWFTDRQEHKHEMERMRLQGELDSAQHARNLDALRVQAELGVKTIEVQAASAISQVDADAFRQAATSISQQSGIWLVDLWNGVIRPLVATVCLTLVILHFWRADWVLDEQGWALCGAALGLYLADRALFKRGK